MPLIRTVTCRVCVRTARNLSEKVSKLVQIELAVIGGMSFSQWHWPFPEMWEDIVRRQAHDYIISRVFER
jgi:hypothetical protein